MAQYRHNFYGTSYYGKTNVYSGWYDSDQYDTDEPLKDTFSVRMQIAMPHAFYAPTSVETTTSSDWSYDDGFGYASTDTVGATYSWIGTGDRLELDYRPHPSGGAATVEVLSHPLGGTAETTTFTLDTSADTVSDATVFALEGLPFGHQEVTLTVDTIPDGGSVDLYGLRARVTDMHIETRAATNEAWTSFALADKVEDTTIDDGYYEITWESPSYTEATLAQFRVYLGTADNTTSPEIDQVEVIAGNTDNRTESGEWEAHFHMEAIADSAGVTFARTRQIRWEMDQPAATTAVWRSQSSTNGTDWSPWTARYRQDTHRLRLREGETTGWVVLPRQDPAGYNDYVTLDGWRRWDDESFLPPVSTGTSVTYQFIDERGETMLELDNPMEASSHRLDALGTQLPRIRMELNARFDRATPVVDRLDLESDMTYDEPKTIHDLYVSAVDDGLDGEHPVFRMENLTFNRPSEFDTPTYLLEDNTERPEDVLVYYESEQEATAKTHETTNREDIIWAKAFAREANTTGQGVTRHYQYGGGSVRYPNEETNDLAPSFTPPLSSGTPYRYYLQHGWPTQEHRVTRGETLDTVAETYMVSTEELEAANEDIVYRDNGDLEAHQRLTLPNDSENNAVVLRWDHEEDLEYGDVDSDHPSFLEGVTDVSTHNSQVAGDSELANAEIVAEVEESSTYGFVEWTSEEKIYTGTLNHEDVQQDYVRTHEELDDERDEEVTYTVQDGETMDSIATSFGIYGPDLRDRNGFGGSEEPEAGRTLRIPSRIALPVIDPAARIGPNPYTIEILYNSVESRDSLIDPSWLEPSLDVIESETDIDQEEIYRGPDDNGADTLHNAKVIEVHGIWAELNDSIAASQYIEGTDFELDGNQIQWLAGGQAPDPNTAYYVSYTCLRPSGLTVTITSDFAEKGGVDRLWRSPEIKTFDGICKPGEDYLEALPPMTDWRGVADASDVEDLAFTVEDDDLWVKTWTYYDEDADTWYLRGSLQGRVPKDEWLPEIHKGTYYIGDQEYYHYAEPIVTEPDEKDMLTMDGVAFASGKYGTAGQFVPPIANTAPNPHLENTTRRAVWSETFDT